MPAFAGMTTGRCYVSVLAGWYDTYGAQDRSVPAISVESTDSLPGQTICDEPDGALLLALALAPELPVADLVPAEVPVLAAVPVVPAVAAPPELVVLCAMPLPARELLVALLFGMTGRKFVPVPFEAGPADKPALLPAWVLFDRLEVVPAVPSDPAPRFVVVPAVCARDGVAMSADRTRAAVSKRMTIDPYLCRRQRRAAAQAVGTAAPDRDLFDYERGASRAVPVPADETFLWRSQKAPSLDQARSVRGWAGSVPASDTRSRKE